MEVEYDSASSKCLGAFERRRETSTMEERWEKIEEKMADESRKTDDLSRDVNRMLRMMETMMNQAIVKFQEDIKVAMEETIEGNMQTIEERLRAEKAAVIIQAFLRTTAVRVKLDRAKYLWGTQRAHIYWVFNTFRLGPWWKDYRERQEAKEKERACGHLDGEWMRLDTDGMETVHVERGLVYNGLEEAFLAYVATDLDGYFVFEYGDGDRVRAKQEGDTLEWSDGAIYYRIGNVLGEGDAISLASGGDKYESFTGDGTFYDANVGGDNDEKYEKDLDFSIAEASPATCESDPMFGTSFASVNIERVFLYFHYEFVKRDFG